MFKYYLFFKQQGATSQAKCLLGDAQKNQPSGPELSVAGVLRDGKPGCLAL